MFVDVGGLRCEDVEGPAYGPSVRPAAAGLDLPPAGAAPAAIDARRWGCGQVLRRREANHGGGGARCRRDTGEACGTRAPVSVSWGVWVGGRAHGSPRSAGGPGKGRVQGDRREDRRHVQSEGCGSHRSDDDAPGGLRVEPTASSRRVGRPRQDGGPAGICVNPNRQPNPRLSRLTMLQVAEPEAGKSHAR